MTTQEHPAMTTEHYTYSAEIDEMLFDLIATDVLQELHAGDEIDVHTFVYRGGNKGQIVVINGDRAALWFGGMSEWGYARDGRFVPEYSDLPQRLFSGHVVDCACETAVVECGFTT